MGNILKNSNDKSKILVAINNCSMGLEEDKFTLMTGKFKHQKDRELIGNINKMITKVRKMYKVLYNRVKTD